jgi:hypothetical protein
MESDGVEEAAVVFEEIDVGDDADEAGGAVDEGAFDDGGAAEFLVDEEGGSVVDGMVGMKDVDFARHDAIDQGVEAGVEVAFGFDAIFHEDDMEADVAVGEDAEEVTGMVDNGQLADMVLVHQLEGMTEAVVGANGDDVGPHDVLNTLHGSLL